MSTLNELKQRLDAARDVALAARVPDEDRDGPASEPVTVTGWYATPTKSGRPAWVHYAWRDGRCYEGECTYDLGAEQAYQRASFEWSEADWLATEHRRGR